MPTTEEVADIVAKVEQRLAEARQNGIHLRVSGNRLDDDWLYVVIEPARAGVRASDHARLMSQIERELRAQGDERVLLVPALEE